MNHADGHGVDAGLDSICICVCTFRRPEGLARLLRSLSHLILPLGMSVRLLVVDNDPAGSGQAVFNEGTCRAVMPCRYMVEPRPGVGHARTRALVEAGTGWVAFIDDDEWAQPQWLAELWRTQAVTGADGVFGPVLASLESPAPDWLIASGFYTRPRRLTGDRLPWTWCASGNVLFKRDLFFKTGGFSAAFAASGGEDSEFFLRCLLEGARFVWCDEAVAHESIPAARMTREWLLVRAFNEGKNYVRVRAKHEGWHAFFTLGLRGLVAACIFAPLAWGARLAGRPSAAKYEVKCQGALGKLAAGWVPAGQLYGAGPPALP